MKRITTTIKLAAILLITVISIPLYADGGFFTIDYNATDVLSPTQRSILFYYKGRETLVLNTGFEGKKTDFAWVIPLPVAIGQEDITMLEDDPFEILFDITEPRYSEYYITTGCGCAAGENVDSIYAGVNIENTFTAGTYDIILLSATDSRNLTAWLKDNGYRIKDEHQPIIENYVNRGFYFAAVKIKDSQNTSLSAEQEGRDSTSISLLPLQISFSTSEPVYPLLISQVSSPENNHILLYLITDTPLQPRNYPCHTMDTNGVSRNKTFAESYNKRFSDILASDNNRAFILEYAGRNKIHAFDLYYWFNVILRQNECESLWLLRYRTIIPKDQMDQDIYFTSFNGVEPFNIQFLARGNRLELPLMIASLMAFAVILRARRKKQSSLHRQDN